MSGTGWMVVFLCCTQVLTLARLAVVTSRLERFKRPTIELHPSSVLPFTRRVRSGR